MPLGEPKPYADALTVLGAHQKALRIVFDVRGDVPAYQYTVAKNGKKRIQAATEQHIKFLQAHREDYAKGYQFGNEVLSGEAVITIDMRELFALAVRAARNTNKTAKQGVAKAKFNGIRGFRENFSDAFDAIAPKV